MIEFLVPKKFQNIVVFENVLKDPIIPANSEKIMEVL